MTDDQPPSDTYYIRARGKIAGPFTIVQLQTLAKRGTFSRIHEVSIDASNWFSAQSLTQIFPPAPPPRRVKPTPPESAGKAMSASGSDLSLKDYKGEEVVLLPVQEEEAILLPIDKSQTYARPSPAKPSVDEGTVYGSSLQKINALCVAEGISAGIVLLFCLNVPHSQSDQALIWWWNVLGQPGAVAEKLSFLYALIAGVSLFFLAPFLRGQARGWAYLALGSIGVLLFLGTGMARGGAGFLLATVGVFCGIVVSISYARLITTHTGGVIQPLFGGAAALAAMFTTAIGVLETVRPQGKRYHPCYRAWRNREPDGDSLWYH